MVVHVNGFTFRNGFGELLPSTPVNMNDLNQLVDILKTKEYAAFVFEPIFDVPFWATVLITILLIFTYTYKGGVKTITMWCQVAVV